MPRRRDVAAVAALLLGLTAGSALGLSAAAAQDADAPATRGYVQQLLAQYARLSDLEGAVRTWLYRLQPRWRVETLEPGQRLIPRDGTMVVVRAGRVRVVDSAGRSFSDLTAGRALGAGAVLPADHLILTPRADGRHLRAETPAIVLIYGDYEKPCETCPPAEGEPSAGLPPARAVARPGLVL